MKHLIFILTASLMLASCKKEEPPTPTPTPTPTPIATGGDHLFCVPSANDYAYMEVYLSGELKTSIQLTTDSQAPSSTTYYGSVYLYNDSTYTIKVKNTAPGSPYFFDKTVVAGSTLQWGTGIGNQILFGSGRWQLKP